MFSRAIDDLSPAGGFPKQRIGTDDVEIVAPPSAYNLYSDVSKLPAYEKSFEDKINEPIDNVGCCASVSGTHERVTLGALNVGRRMRQIMEKERMRLVTGDNVARGKGLFKVMQERVPSVRMGRWYKRLYGGI